MTIELRWDAKFLKDHERATNEQVNDAVRAEDWARARMQVHRELSDALDGYLRCPLAACRRAQRCIGDQMLCREIDRLPDIDDQDLVAEVYADIQHARRAAADIDDKQ